MTMGSDGSAREVDREGVEAAGLAASVHTPNQARWRLAGAVGAVLILVGVYPLLDGATYQGSEDGHAAIEMAGSLLGLMAGIALMIRFYAVGSRFDLFVGLAFLVNGAEDLAHGLLAFDHIHGLAGLSTVTLEQAIPATYVAGRLLMGVLLLIAPLAAGRFGEGTRPRREALSTSLAVVIVATLATGLAFAVPLPRFIYPDRLIARPVDVGSALVFVAAFVAFSLTYHRGRDKMVWWLLLAIGVHAAGQFVMSFSRALYDPFFDVAHVYKVIGYAIPLLGLSLYQIALMTASGRTTTELRRHHGLLEKSVRERTAALETLNRELQSEIKEREQAEEALKNSEALYQSLVETLPLSVFRKDLYERFIFGNKAFCEALGHSLEEIVGKTDRDFFPAELAEKYRDDDREVIESKQVRKAIEDHQTPTGERIYVEVVKAPVYDYRGRVVGTQGIFWDVTARVVAEEQLRRLTDALQRSNQELEQFASVASHDLQEPLRKIEAFGDRLATRCSDQLDEQGCDYLARMQKAAGRMRTLINDLLTLSRVTSRAQPFVPVDLDDVVREVLGDLEVRIEETQGRVETEGLGTIDADPTQMRQLFQNLIGNALKFRREGESPIIRVRAEVTIPEAPPDEDDTSADAICRIEVRDNGIGFDAKYAERIFGVFQRLHGRGEYEGTGIGLAVCQKIAHRHGGEIAASSGPDEGATFVVSLPAKHTSGEPPT